MRLFVLLIDKHVDIYLMLLFIDFQSRWMAELIDIINQHWKKYEKNEKKKTGSAFKTMQKFIFVYYICTCFCYLPEANQLSTCIVRINFALYNVVFVLQEDGKKGGGGRMLIFECKLDCN